jgi:hypothetical protein
MAILRIRRPYLLAVAFGLALLIIPTSPGIARVATEQSSNASGNTLQQLGLGLLLLLFGTLLQMVATNIVLAWIYSRKFERWSKTQSLRSAIATMLSLFVLFTTAVLQVMLWALLYDLGGALDSFSDALYFSLVTFTSLGYGDVTVGLDWRLVAGCQALSGLLLVGWSTALLVVVLQRIWVVRHQHYQN